MEPGSIVTLLVIIVLIILSGIFSASETAFSTAQKARLTAMADDGKKQANKVLKLLENYDKILSTILVGNNIINITTATLGTIFFATLIADVGLANTISTIAITVVVLIFGEITPKNIAKEKPEEFAITFYPFIRFWMFILYPICLIFSGWKWLLGKIFKFKKEVTFTEEELINIVETAENEGELEAHESELIKSAIEFEDREVIDIMIPRVNVISLDIKSKNEDIYNTYIESGYSRLPVFEGTIDNVKGVLHEKDFFRFMHDGNKGIKKILQKPLRVPSTMKISAVLQEIQRNKMHMAIVVDEFGGTMGIVTLEDILEELVGEIYDEHDDVEEFVKKVSETEYVVSGEENVMDLFEELEVYLNEKDEDEQVDSTTVGGFVTEQLGKLPSCGEKFSFKNLDFEITKATETRVEEVKLTVNPVEDEE